MIHLQAGGSDRRDHRVDHGSPRRDQVDGVTVRVAARVPGEVDVGRLHRDQAAAFEGDDAAELAAGKPWQPEIAKRGPGLGDRDPGVHGSEAAGIEGAAHGHRQQRCRDAIHHRPLGEQYFGVMGEAPAVGLEQPQLCGAKIQANPGGHWNDSQSIAQLAFFPPLADVIWAVSVRLVPVAWTRTV